MVNLRDRYGLGALSLYSTLSLLFFGRGLLGHFSERYMGFGPDPSVGINMLAWWPYALSHRLNPLIATTLWAPYGFNLTWSTCVPLVALLVSPITRRAGPGLRISRGTYVFQRASFRGALEGFYAAEPGAATLEDELGVTIGGQQYAWTRDPTRPDQVQRLALAHNVGSSR